MLIEMKKSNKLVKTLNKSMWDLPTPSSINYYWNMGSTLGICLMIQVVTGLMLSFFYTSYSEESFSSVMETIMRNIWGGWTIRFMHMNGSSMFFFFLYLHLFRGMYFSSQVNQETWMSGVTIMLMLMGISFLGYVLPWGQMSYWAVAVITNLLSIIPLVGSKLVMWIWGGFSVSSPTLTRFYSLHFMLPFLLIALVMLHLMLLHEKGSSNPMGVSSNMDKIPFHPYFTIKDSLFLSMVYMMFFLLIYTNPMYLGDPVNNMPANPMQTPEHIKPEWYFLSSYAILRAMPSKTMGVMALVASVAIFYVMPMFKMKFPTKFSIMRKTVYWMMISSFLFLMKMGSQPAEEPYIMLSKTGSMFYFATIMLINL